MVKIRQKIDFQFHSTSIHLANASFRDSPTYDAYGPMAKDKKIKSLRRLIVENEEKIFDSLVFI